MPGDHPSKQLCAGSVLGWVTAGPRLAHRNAELNSQLYWHRFFAISLCVRTNAEIMIVTFLRQGGRGSGGNRKRRTVIRKEMGKKEKQVGNVYK